MDFSEAINDFISSRVFLSARDIQECFRLARGVSVSRTTLDAWEGRGLWVKYIEGRKWYRWELTWAFYLSLTGRITPRSGRVAPKCGTNPSPPM